MKESKRERRRSEREKVVFEPLIMIRELPREVEEWAKRLKKKKKKKKKKSCLGEAVKRSSEFLADSTSTTICLPIPFLYKDRFTCFLLSIMGPIYTFKTLN